MINDQTACHLVESAAEAVQADWQGFAPTLEAIPAAVYVTDGDGTLVYYNRHCVDLAGRTPQAGVDKWCVTWKIFTPEGEAVPHEECPMAVAIKQRKPVRGVEAVAERPDGTRVSFVPYPTPIFGDDGELKGAINLLLDVTEQRKPEYLRQQADRCLRLAAAIGDAETAETLMLMAAKYEEQSLKQAS